MYKTDANLLHFAALKTTFYAIVAVANPVQQGITANVVPGTLYIIQKNIAMPVPVLN